MKGWGVRVHAIEWLWVWFQAHWREVPAPIHMVKHHSRTANGNHKGWSARLRHWDPSTDLPSYQKALQILLSVQILNQHKNHSSKSMSPFARLTCHRMFLVCQTNPLNVILLLCGFDQRFPGLNAFSPFIEPSGNFCWTQFEDTFQKYIGWKHCIHLMGLLPSVWISPTARCDLEVLRSHQIDILDKWIINQ